MPPTATPDPADDAWPEILRSKIIAAMHDIPDVDRAERATSRYQDRVGVNVHLGDGRTWRIHVILEPIPADPTQPRPDGRANPLPPPERCYQCHKTRADHDGEFHRYRPAP